MKKKMETMIDKENKMKKAKNIFGLFHNDLDGYMSGKVSCIFTNMKSSLYIAYNDITKQIDEFCKNQYTNFDGLIIGDLNLDCDNLKKLTKLANTGYPIMYFDHHYKTKEQIDCLNKSGIINKVDRTLCGANITYRYFKESNFPYSDFISLDRLETLLKNTEDWDLFKWQDPNTFEILNESARDFNIYFNEFGPFKTMEKVNNYINGKFDDFFSNIEITNIRLIKRMLSKAVKDRHNNLITTQYSFEGNVMDIGITYADRDISEIGNRLNILNKNLAFIVIVDMIHKSVSFRTIFDYPNLANVAALYGGGGHPKASGCALNNESFNAFVNVCPNKDFERNQR